MFVFTARKPEEPQAKKEIYRYSISFLGGDLVQFLEDLGEKCNVEFTINLKEPIKIHALDFKNETLDNILKNVCSKYNLEFSIENRMILIKKSEAFWKTYSMKFFFEDDLSNLSSFFNEIKSKEDSNKNDKKDDLEQIKQSRSSIFWDEIEKNIKKITDDKFAIDRYNGVINIFGNRELHDKIGQYLEYVTKNLYQQVLIECKVVEISTSIERNLDLQPILSSMSTGSHSMPITTIPITACVQEFIASCRKMYTNVQIKTSTDIHMLLMSQHTGRILSSKIDFFEEREYENYSKNYRDAKVTKKTFKNNEHGFSLTIVPLILDDSTIILKLRPSLSVPQSRNSISENKPKDIQRREFNTVIRSISGQNHVLGGLYLEHDVQNESIIGKSRFLQAIFNRHINEKQKSYFVLFIKVTIC
jgi:hypothetical protein